MHRMAGRFAAVPFPSLFLPSRAPLRTNALGGSDASRWSVEHSLRSSWCPLARNLLPSVTGIWLSILVSAVLFGLGHLPVASSYVSINSMTITEAIVNNGVIGIICGWLYWKKGLESAMIAHFSSDVVLHLIVPLILARMA